MKKKWIFIWKYVLVALIVLSFWMELIILKTKSFDLSQDSISSPYYYYCVDDDNGWNG